MKKMIFFMLLALVTQAGHAAITKKRDSEQNCTLYKVVNPDENGKLNIASDEVIVNQKDAYGLSFVDMEIDFENREVLVRPTINIIMGLNRPLINGKGIIKADNQDFNFLINQLNRKLYVFEKVCIGDNNVIAYAKMFETKPDQIQK